MLAGIGTSWYTWLEQGRDINVSESVARAIGRALCLDRSEVRYLYQLLGITPPQPTVAVGERTTVDLRHVVDECLPSPALVVDSLWNLLGFNASAALVFGFTPEDRNLLISFFTNPEIWSRYAEPELMARMAVAQFRISAAGHYDDPLFNNVVTTLCEQSPQFAALWYSHEVLDSRMRHKEVNHPTVGRLVFDTHSWQLDGPEQIRMFLHIPRRHSDTRRKLECLLDQHAREHALPERVTA